VSKTCTVRVTIVNRLGLHARPAMSFVDLAGAYRCEIKVARVAASAGGSGGGGGGGGSCVDGKSIMQMMMLAATKGTELEITAVGEDAEEACAALKQLVESGFGEE